MFALDEDRPGPLAREVEVGNVEYKLKLIEPTSTRFEQLVTQLKWRLAEGGGEAIYEIGVEDDGSLRGLSEADMEESLHTLQRMCNRLKAHMLVRYRRSVGGGEATVAEVLVRAVEVTSKPEVRVAFLGGPQSGKSTLVAGLATGQRDNGQGSARTLVMRHPHELQSGTTSSISEHTIGFDAHGRLVNSADATFGTSSASEIVAQSARLVTLLDLCGEERYLKTTLYGLTAHAPDFAILAVRADQPVITSGGAGSNSGGGGSSASSGSGGGSGGSGSGGGNGGCGGGRRKLCCCNVGT